MSFLQQSSLMNVQNIWGSKNCALVDYNNQSHSLLLLVQSSLTNVQIWGSKNCVHVDYNNHSHSLLLLIHTKFTYECTKYMGVKELCQCRLQCSASPAYGNSNQNFRHFRMTMQLFNYLTLLLN